jgi:hypothetical protein
MTGIAAAVSAFISSPRMPSLIHRFTAGFYVVNRAGCKMLTRSR